MKPPRQKARVTFLISLLTVSVLAFGLDLFHMLYHLMRDPVLFQIQGVGMKLLQKIFCFSLPLVFLAKRRDWLAWILFLAVFFYPSSASALEACRHARELLDKSGMARDASENLLGQLKTKPPYGTFPSDMDQIAWWGSFKPFEFWENPQFQSVWINPDGQETARQKFRGQKCALAKSVLSAERQPRGEFAPGMWSVLVTCGDYLIDKQNFAVLPASPPARGPSDKPGKSSDSAMIWAKDEVK